MAGRRVLITGVGGRVGSLLAARLGPEAAEDRALVLELSERVRTEVQQALSSNLVGRGPAFI